MIDTPMKRRVLRSGTAIISDNESGSSQKYGNRKVSDDESHLEMMRLKKQLAELKANLEPLSQLVSEQLKLVPDVGTRREPSPDIKRANPAEGRSLGTFDGSTDLDTFLVRLESCSRYFGWSESEKVFHLMNALTGSAEPIVKEVGPTGSLEHVLELLQSRFGTKLYIDKFHAELRRRKRGSDETLQELYLDLCRLRVLASGESSDEKFPEIYFRNIFVDALNDRELRREVLIQNPGTMEAAYNVATRLELIIACETPLRDQNRQSIRQIDLENKNLESSKQSTDLMDDVARRIEELEGTLQSMKMMTGTYEQVPYFPTESSINESFQEPVQYPLSDETSGQTHGEGTFHNTHEKNVPLGRGKRSGWPTRRSCYTCGENGHYSRGCKQSHRRSKSSEGHVTREFMSHTRCRTKSGDRVSGTKDDGNFPVTIRREAYLEIQMNSRKMLALLDSGCEQSVIGRNLVKRVPLEPTNETLSTADGTDVPLIGETTIELSVCGFVTNCRVVVTDVITELILGIDWMQQNNCVWNFGTNSFSIDGHPGRLRCNRASRTVRRILVHDDVVVPGMHTVEVPVLVTRSSLGREDQNWGMTTKMKNSDLVIANAIYGSSEVLSVCQIMNISDLPKRLKKGSELGKAEPVEILETMDSGSSKSIENSTGTNGLKGPAFDEMPLDLRQIKSTDGQELQYSDMEKFDQTEIGSTISSQNSGTEPTDFVQEMIQKIDLDLTDEQKQDVERLLQDHREVFSTSEFDLGRIGRTNLVQHKIDTGTNRPFKQQLRRHPMAYLPVIDEHVDKMLANDICEPSVSPWASNVVLVKKSDGTLRFCVDYRQLNNLTTKDSYPLPRIDTCFDALGGARYFSTLDLRQGYWQVENDPESSDKTTFITRKGSFKFKVLPFGLSNAPAVFQRLMNMVMQGLTWEACLVFLDDIIVISSTFEQHLERLSAVFQRLKAANLKLKPSKCRLFQIKVKFLGSVVSADGIEPDPDKLNAISDWPVPENLTELRAFVGLASYYRRHVEGFSDIAKPLSELTKKNQPFIWGSAQQNAFELLKYRLTHYPVLAPPLPEGKYIIDTDASDFAMGAVLQQEQFGTIRVIAYASKTFDASERMYCTTRKELAAVIYALKEFRHYVLGGKLFLLRTDHGALTSLFKVPVPIQQQARYLSFLADYNFEIQHRAGSQHGNSDGLSRRPCGSKKCTRDDCEIGYRRTDENHRTDRSVLRQPEPCGLGNHI